MGFIHRIKSLFAPILPKKKILAVALGSGGAKGMAHLGVLKALEEEKITFDRFAGTSIGSVVGALKAAGYQTQEITDVVHSICLKQYVKYLRPYMSTAFVEELLNEYLRYVDFDGLKKPFWAWATDKNTLQGVLLEQGSVARACVASCAIPPYFHSVSLGGRELIDGVYTNPMPADVLKERGAQFVLGVDLNVTVDGERVKPYSRITKAVSGALDSTVKIKPKADAVSRGYDACDFVLKLPLQRFNPLDAGAGSLKEMYDIGYEEAKKNAPFIRKKIAQSKRA